MLSKTAKHLDDPVNDTPMKHVALGTSISATKVNVERVGGESEKTINRGNGTGRGHARERDQAFDREKPNLNEKWYVAMCNLGDGNCVRYNVESVHHDDRRASRTKEKHCRRIVTYVGGRVDRLNT